MKNLSVFQSASLSSLALVCGALCAPAWAQNDPSAAASAAAGAVQRSVEASQQRIPVKPSQSIAGDLLDLSGLVSLDRLDALEIKSDRFQAEIQAYWAPLIGKPVSEDQVIAFKTWFYDKAKASGFMAYAQTDAEGNKLIVTLVMPKVNSIRIFAKDEALARRYVKELSARFEDDFKPGMPVNVIALEQKLDAVSFSMPVELDVVIRSAGPELLDLIVNVTEAANQAGKVLGGLVQLNNYGLYNFGRAQVMGQVTVGGHSPSAKFTLTGQKSEGISYGRADYDMPLAAVDARMRVALGHSRSEGIYATESRSKGYSSDVSWGLDKILGYRSDIVFKGALDLSARENYSNLASSGAEVSRIHEQQLRLKWSADNDRLSADPMRLELTGVAGHYSTVVGLPLVPTGQFSKFEFNARKQVRLSDDGQVFGLFKLRGQRTSHHVDGYNQISLGGSSGVRAYTTADGVGTDGMVGSVEINRRIKSNQTMGVFCDGGLVRASKIEQPGVFSGTYSLHALGVQLSGNQERFYYNASLAKGLGGNKGARSTDQDSTPNNWRLGFSGTYVF